MTPLPSREAKLVGGLHDGETIVPSMVSRTVRCAGALEDARLTGYDDDGDPVYSYAVEEYDVETYEPLVYRYARTGPEAIDPRPNMPSLLDHARATLPLVRDALARATPEGYAEAENQARQLLTLVRVLGGQSSETRY